VLDPAEIELSTLGAVKLHDLETSEQLFTDINNVLVSEHKDELESHISAVKTECNRLDADFFSFRTDLPIFEAIYRTIHGR
jgi:delta 1-pyrroline-5-carboxylate dehydrogenase